MNAGKETQQGAVICAFTYRLLKEGNLFGLTVSESGPLARAAYIVARISRLLWPQISKQHDENGMVCVVSVLAGFIPLGFL